MRRDEIIVNQETDMEKTSDSVEKYIIIEKLFGCDGGRRSISPCLDTDHSRIVQNKKEADTK